MESETSVQCADGECSWCDDDDCFHECHELDADAAAAADVFMKWLELRTAGWWDR